MEPFETETCDMAGGSAHKCAQWSRPRGKSREPGAPAPKGPGRGDPAREAMQKERGQHLCCRGNAGVAKLPGISTNAKRDFLPSLNWYFS